MQGQSHHEPYSYRADPAVPPFADDNPIIIFDGHCVLCSHWAQFVIRHDTAKTFKLLAAQTPLGEALYRHYGLRTDDYETNILIANGVARFKTDGIIRMLTTLGWPWSLARVLRIIPGFARDWAYAILARNRLRIFGRSDTCFAPTPDIRERFLQ